MDRKKVMSLTNDLLTLIDENQELKRELQFFKESATSETVTISDFNKFLIDLGTEQFYEKILRETRYHSDLNVRYYEDGVNVNYSEWHVYFLQKFWYEVSIGDIKIPETLSINQINEWLEPLAKQEYERRRQEAQLEYARKIKSEKGESE